MDNGSLVSVVIPSMGRASLGVAIASVLQQSYFNCEVVVRLDPRAPEHADQALPADPRVRVVHAESPEEISVSRAKALADCRGAFIAFLDDDNRFLEKKLEKQVAAATRILSMGADHVVVGSRVLSVDSAGRSQIVPRQLKTADQQMSDYLFRRHQIRPGQTAVGATMLLCDKGLALELASGAPSSLHEDWEWALRAEQQPNTVFMMVPEVLSEYTGQPHGASASSRANWRLSAKWLHDHESLLSRRCQADFLLCFTLPLAVAQGDRKGALEVMARSLKAGIPGPSALMFAVLYVTLPGSVRRWFTASALRVRGRAGRLGSRRSR